MIVHQEGMTQAQEDEAHSVLDLLTVCYPGHPWSVRVAGGVIFIRHLEFEGNWGMNIRVTEFDHDSAVLKKKIIMLAGEWLERAGMRRGRFEDQPTTNVEGVPQEFQPRQSKPPIDMAVVVEKAQHAVQAERTTPRAQVAKLMENDLRGGK